jgi:colicin import membrane protein
MASTSNDRSAFALSLGLHALVLLAIWASASWILPVQDEPAAGEPIQATLQLSAADVRRAQQAIDKASKAQPEPPKAPAPQPKPVEKPQVADAPPQPVPQERLDKPDTEDQEAISKLAEQPAETPAPREQEERARQEQVDLTEQEIRRRIAERRQQLRAQMLAIQKEREAAARRTRLEEQRLQQLADAQPAPAPRPGPPAPQAGNRGQDAGLLAKYKAAMQLTADGNWNHLGLPPRTQCKVRFTQITGGEVINVEFIDCPYDAEGRDSVDRALRKTPMPYSGFESVFARLVTLNFSYPREECAP